MGRYALTRLAVVVPILIVVSFLAFLLMHLLPGNPVDVICGTGCSAAGRIQLTRQLGLNRPLLSQYWLFVDHALHGNLGRSYVDDESVSHMIAQKLPETLELMFLSQVFAFVISIPLAIFSALRPEARFDRSASLFSFGLLAIPTFVVGVFLVVLFAVDIHIFPATGYAPLTQNLGENLKDMVLPVVSLGIGSVAIYHRVLRSDLVATFQEDFITMAKAKGLPTRYIVLRHALRPSALTFITLVGINVGTLITGAFVVEIIFDLPGIGSMMLTAVNQSDYLVVQGTALVVTVGFVAVNLVADLLNALMDPRIRLRGATA